MWGHLFSILIQSKLAKTGAGLVTGSGVLVLILGLHQDVLTKIEKQKLANKEYVGLVLTPVETEIRHLKENTKETKQLVRDIHNYLLRRNNKGK